MATITPTEVVTGITGLRCVKWEGINANTSDVGAPAYIAGAEDLILYCTVTDASASAAWVWEMSPEPTPADANYFTLMTSTNAAITPTSLTAIGKSAGIVVGSRGLWLRFRVSTPGADAGAVTLYAMWRMAK